MGSQKAKDWKKNKLNETMAGEEMMDEPLNYSHISRKSFGGKDHSFADLGVSKSPFI